MLITRLSLKNWRNFKKINIHPVFPENTDESSR